MSSCKPLFIAIEGPDGVGKTSVINLLKYDISLPNNIVFERDPGGPDVSEKIRELVLLNKDNISKEARYLLYLAARAELAKKRIIPAIQAGDHVISDRWDLSTRVYQIRLGNLLPEVNTFTNAMIGVYPDYYIFLDAPDYIINLRLANRVRTDKVIHDLKDEKTTYIRNLYREEAKNTHNTAFVDASGTAYETFRKVSDIIAGLLTGE